MVQGQVFLNWGGWGRGGGGWGGGTFPIFTCKKSKGYHIDFNLYGLKVYI